MLVDLSVSSYMISWRNAALRRLRLGANQLRGRFFEARFFKGQKLSVT